MSLSTHVLDTMRGTPAAGLEVTLHRREPDGDWTEIAQAVTDSEGRVSRPLATRISNRRSTGSTSRPGLTSNARD